MKRVLFLGPPLLLAVWTFNTGAALLGHSRGLTQYPYIFQRNGRNEMYALQDVGAEPRGFFQETLRIPLNTFNFFKKIAVHVYHGWKSVLFFFIGIPINMAKGALNIVANAVRKIFNLHSGMSRVPNSFSNQQRRYYNRQVLAPLGVGRNDFAINGWKWADRSCHGKPGCKP